MEDSLIRFEWGESTATSLLLKDRDVQFKSYEGLDHEIGVDEVCRAEGGMRGRGADGVRIGRLYRN
jgi:hypothetical protein